MTMLQNLPTTETLYNMRKHSSLKNIILFNVYLYNLFKKKSMQLQVIRDCKSSIMSFIIVTCLKLSIWPLKVGAWLLPALSLGISKGRN